MLSELVRRDKLLKVGQEVKEYTIKEKLGEGRYGIAYLAYSSLGQKVVIKQLKKAMIKRCEDKLKYEEIILKKLKNPMFPKYIGKFNYDKLSGYIIEYKEGKTFEDIIYKDNYVFNKKEIYCIAEKLINIIECLYSQNIVHKDIRVSNVVINEQGQIYLIDFGLARFMDGNKYTKDMDFWYLGDFLIHMYYTSYTDNGDKEKPWYEELDISEEEKVFLKRLMGIEEKFKDLQQLKSEFYNIKDFYKDK